MVVPLKPEVKILQVTESAIRLDKYLAKEYPDLSRSRLQKLIEQCYIKVNGCGAKASQKLNVGDEIHISLTS